MCTDTYPCANPCANPSSDPAAGWVLRLDGAGYSRGDNPHHQFLGGRLLRPLQVHLGLRGVGVV